MKQRAIHAAMFLAIFCSPYNQFTYWFSIAVLPLLLYGRPNISCFKLEETKVLYAYVAVAVITFFSSFILLEFYYPSKAACLMLCSCLVNACVLGSVKSGKDLYYLCDGIIIACAIFSLVLFMSVWSGGLTFSYEDENSWLGKNVLSLNIYLGVICSALMLKMTSKQYYLLPFLVFFLIVVMSTSLKVIIASVFLLFVTFTSIQNKMKIMCLVVILTFFYCCKDMLIEFFAYGDGKLIYNRILTLFGFSKYTTMQLEFVDGREELMQSALKIFYENPIGVGLENTRLFMDTYSHNTFIELLCGGSIVLVTAFSVYLFRIIKVIYQKKNENGLFWMSIGIFCSMIFISNAMKIYDSMIALFILFFLARVNNIHDFNNRF